MEDARQPWSWWQLLADRPESAIIFPQDLGLGIIQDNAAFPVRPVVGRMEWPPRAWVLGTKNA